MSNLKKMTDWGKLQKMLDDQDAKAKGGSKIDEQASRMPPGSSVFKWP